jgi:peroxiredoxin
MTGKLQAGATLPDFELPDDTGAIHRLSELQGDNPMILMLARGEHCPRERQHQREIVTFYNWCPVAFTAVVSIFPNNIHDTNKMRIATGAFWTYLADVDLEVQRTLEIREYTDPHHDANVPITLVLAPGLVIEKIYTGYYFWGRPSPYQLWDDLANLFRRIKPDFDPLTDEAKAAWEAAQKNGGKKAPTARRRATAPSRQRASAARAAR